MPASKNCSATENHFNPYNGTVRAATPAAHEVGDLAGKHGNIMGESYKTEYDDSYISLNEKQILHWRFINCNSRQQWYQIELC